MHPKNSHLPHPLRIGTRRSKLALTQTEMVVAELQKAAPELAEDGRIEIVPMETSGDTHLTQSLADIGGKGLFAKEIEQALLDKRIDCAVHSMKDMETQLPTGLIIPCLLPREDVRDAIILRDRSHTLAALPKGATFGTSSVRRAAQIRRLRPDLKIVEFRGNVQTRLQKLRDGVADATTLAYAGIKRLGLEADIRTEFGLELMDDATMLNAAAQGAIGIECRAGDSSILQLLNKISCSNTAIKIECERALLHKLDGSCRTPIAALARLDEAAQMLQLQAELYSEDGTERYATTAKCPLSTPSNAPHAEALRIAENLGKQAAETLFSQRNGYHTRQTSA